MNWYIEMIEVPAGKAEVVLYPTPGLSNSLYNLGPDGVRWIDSVNGRTFAIAGINFYELLGNGQAVPRGNVVSDGKPCSVAIGLNQILIASVGVAYVFDLLANILTAIDAAVLTDVIRVTYCEGFFLSLVKVASAPNQIRQSGPAPTGATDWDAAEVEIPEAFTDNAIALFSDHNETWVFSPTGIQPYFNAGDFPFAFDIIQGSFIEGGLASPDAIAKWDNSIAWLGADSRGNGIVRRANGYSPIRISDHALEYAMQKYPTIADCVMYSHQFNGHEMLRLTFPTAEKSWECDAATGRWHEVGFWNTQAGRYTRHRAQFHTFNFGKHLVGDPTTGAVYEMSDLYNKDFGNVLRRELIGPHLCQEQKYISVGKFQLDIEAGVGPVPPLSGWKLPTVFILQDELGGTWGLGVTDLGELTTAPQVASPQPLFITDGQKSWQITIDSEGRIKTTQVDLGWTSTQAYQMVGMSGNIYWDLTVTDIGVLETSGGNPVTRGPEVMLQWSKDGGHSYGQETVREFGEAGDYKKRTIWYRQGRARDWVPKISVTDPVPARIIAAYAEAG